MTSENFLCFPFYSLVRQNISCVSRFIHFFMEERKFLYWELISFTKNIFKWQTTSKKSVCKWRQIFPAFPIIHFFVKDSDFILNFSVVRQSMQLVVHEAYVGSYNFV